MKIKFSDDAKEDIQDIADYTFEIWGEEQEEIYLHSLYQRLEEIAETPARWSQREDLFPGCQRALIGKHIIFFRIHKNEIFVSRILHQAMDVPRHIFPTQEG